MGWKVKRTSKGKEWIFNKGLKIKGKLKAGSKSRKGVYLTKKPPHQIKLMPQDIKKARKHQETELQGRNLDLLKICTDMYVTNWDGDTWNRLDGSNEEASKVKSVTVPNLVKQEIITDGTFGNEPETWNTTKAHYFNTDDLWKIQITWGINQWLYQLWCDRAEGCLFVTEAEDLDLGLEIFLTLQEHTIQTLSTLPIRWAREVQEQDWGEESMWPRQGLDKLQGECYKWLS